MELHNEPCNDPCDNCTCAAEPEKKTRRTRKDKGIVRGPRGNARAPTFNARLDKMTPETLEAWSIYLINAVAAVADEKRKRSAG